MEHMAYGIYLTYKSNQQTYDFFDTSEDVGIPPFLFQLPCGKNDSKQGNPSAISFQMGRIRHEILHLNHHQRKALTPVFKINEGNSQKGLTYIGVIPSKKNPFTTTGTNRVCWG